MVNPRFEIKNSPVYMTNKSAKPKIIAGQPILAQMPHRKIMKNICVEEEMSLVLRFVSQARII